MKKILTICIVLFNAISALGADSSPFIFYRVTNPNGALVYNSSDSASNYIIDIIHRGDVVQLFPTYDFQTEEDWKRVELIDRKFGYVKVKDFEYCYQESYYDHDYAYTESTKTLFDDIVYGKYQLLLPHCQSNFLVAIICIVCIAMVYYLVKRRITKKDYPTQQIILQSILMAIEFYLLNNEYKYIGMVESSGVEGVVELFNWLLTMFVILIQLLSITNIFDNYSKRFNCSINWNLSFLPLPVLVLVIPLILYLYSEYNGEETGINSCIVFLPLIIFISICVLYFAVSFRKTNKKELQLGMPVFYVLTSIIMIYFIGRICCPLLNINSLFIKLILYMFLLIVYLCGLIVVKIVKKCN